jgi:hypothetical protein
MEITTRTGEQQPPDAGQNRITEILVKRLHRSGLNATGEAISHDQFVALS